VAPTPLGVCRGFLTSVCLLHRCVEVSGAQVRWVDVLKDSAITKGAGVGDLRTLRMASCEEAIIASWEGGAVRAPFSRATPGVARSWGVWEGGAVRAPASRAARGVCGRAALFGRRSPVLPRGWPARGVCATSPNPRRPPDDAASQCSPVRETVYFVLRCASTLNRQ